LDSRIGSVGKRGQLASTYHLGWRNSASISYWCGEFPAIVFEQFVLQLLEGSNQRRYANRSKTMTASPRILDAIGLAVIGIALAIILCSCASVHQQGTTSTTDPKTGIVTTQSADIRVVASGDSKTIVEKIRASAGKTVSLGASGVSEENSLSTVVAAVAEALVKAMETGFAAGAGARVPVGIPATTIP
jgi:hypothetical protein